MQRMDSSIEPIPSTTDVDNLIQSAFVQLFARAHAAGYLTPYLVEAWDADEEQFIKMGRKDQDQGRP